MINYANNGVKVALIRKPKNKEDMSVSPIYWRVTYKRKQVYFFTGFSYSEKEWSEFTEKNLQKSGVQIIRVDENEEISINVNKYLSCILGANNII